MKISVLIIILQIIFLPLAAQKNYRIRDIDFKGNKVLSDKELLSTFNTQPKKSIERLLFWKKHPDLIASVFDDDIDRLQSFYIRNGFLHTTIRHELDSARFRRLVKVTIHVDENIFVKTDSIGLNLTGDSAAAKVLDSLKSEIPLRKNERFIDENVFESEKTLRQGYSDNGYPFADVDHSIKLSEDTLNADVIFDITSGFKFFFGDVTITGNSGVPEKFIRKYFTFAPGDVYSQKKIDKTQKYLFNTDIFQYVVIASRKDSLTGDMIPLEIMVRELPRWSLEAGAGYGTEDRVRLAAEITRRNFLGGARKLILDLKTSYFMPFSIDTRFVQPDIFLPRLDLIINPFYRREREISYEIDRMGGSVSLLYQLYDNLNANLSYAYEYDDILERKDLQLDEIELKHNKSIISLGNELNLTNDPFYPSKGLKINTKLAYAGLSPGSEVRFYKIQAAVMNYTSLTDEVVLASKLRSGIIQSTQSRRTPLEERFFLGGASSLRGWGRHQVSPVNDSGFAIGGNTMIEGSVELRFPVYDIIHGAVFFDAGNVWMDSYTYKLDLLNYNAGIGLRVRTPIGPIRLDFASPVINDGFDFQFFVSVGHAF